MGRAGVERGHERITPARDSQTPAVESPAALGRSQFFLDEGRNARSNLAADSAPPHRFVRSSTMLPTQKERVLSLVPRRRWFPLFHFVAKRELMQHTQN